MARLLLILLISCAYIGCAPSARYGASAPVSPEAGPSERRRAGGSVRVLVGSGLAERAVVLGAVGAPLTSAGVAVALRPPAGDPDGTSGGCWHVELDPDGVGADGQPLRPAAIAAAWEAALRQEGSPLRWLLEPVEGVAELVAGLESHAAGLQVSGGTLALCTVRPAPDLPARLAHPALWYFDRGDGEGAREGPGPFREDGVGTLVASPHPNRSEPFLERIELVRDQGHPSLLLRLDEADLGLLLGRQAGPLLDAPHEALRLQRVSTQDRIYFLWLDATRRWVNDPRFRRWLGGVIDREAMLRHLFDDRGEPVFQLLGEEFGGPVWQPRDRAPFAATSRPRGEMEHRVVGWLPIMRSPSRSGIAGLNREPGKPGKEVGKPVPGCPPL